VTLTLAGCNVALFCVVWQGYSTLHSLKTGEQLIGQCEGENSQQQLRAGQSMIELSQGVRDASLLWLDVAWILLS